MAKELDIDLATWLHLLFSGKELLRQLRAPQTAQLSGVVETFRENILQVFQVAIFPEAVYMTGRRYQLAESVAFFKVYGEPLPDSFSGQVPSEVASERDKILDGASGPQIHPFILRPRETEKELSYGSPSMAPISGLLMSMQVVAAWTVFETLFGDLWEASVNAHPNGLSDLKGKGFKGRSADQDQHQDNLTERGSLRKINLNSIQKFDYDLKESMGSLLRSEEKFAFTRLDGKNGIRSAYHAAFFEHADDIAKALDDMHLRAVNVMRNLIVHKAGRCDSEYLAAADSIPSHLPKLDIGQKLELNGGLLHNQLIPALQACTDLIRAVDSWIVNHP